MKEGIETVKVTSSNRQIVIKISVSGLIFASENKGDLKSEGFKVFNRGDFSEEVASQIRGAFYDSETGLTKFEMFLDEVVEEVIESGSECIIMDGLDD